MSELGDKRTKFTRYIYRLLGYLYSEGYEPRFDKEHCNHMKNSLHYQGLAKDILLFKGGVYLDKTEHHEMSGKFWKALDKDCCWGGDFSIPDGNHYSLTFGGFK